MKYIGFRPMPFASGIVRNSPTSPPRLKQLVASAFHCSPSTRAALTSSPCAAAVPAARPFATSGMNALQLHHVMIATSDIASPEIVMPRYLGENSSAIRGGAAWVVALAQRSGSLTNIRTAIAAAAGISPVRNT